MGMHKNGGRVAYKTGGKVMGKKRADGGMAGTQSGKAVSGRPAFASPFGVMNNAAKFGKDLQDTLGTGPDKGPCRAMGGKAPVKMTDGAGGGLGRLQKIKRYGK